MWGLHNCKWLPSFDDALLGTRDRRRVQLSCPASGRDVTMLHKRSADQNRGTAESIEEVRRFGVDIHDLVSGCCAHHNGRKTQYRDRSIDEPVLELRNVGRLAKICRLNTRAAYDLETNMQGPSGKILVDLMPKSGNPTTTVGPIVHRFCTSLPPMCKPPISQARIQ
jgi:hypothetical protein